MWLGETKIGLLMLRMNKVVAREQTLVAKDNPIEVVTVGLVIKENQ